MCITKGVIVCAGLGTRSLPATKVIPKELTPILNRPALDYIVDEMIDSGIKDILIVISKDKEIIKKYFKNNKKYYDYVKNNDIMRRRYLSTIKNANITYAYQNTPIGSGDALCMARDFVGNEPFCAAWGDEIMQSKTPVIKQLIKCYETTKKLTVGLKKVSLEDTKKYGIVNPISSDKYLLCDRIVEKPTSNPPSLYASVGRYIFSPDIFDKLASARKGDNSELPLTDAIEKYETFAGCIIQGKRFDIGSIDDLVKLTNYEYKKIKNSSRS